MEISNTKTKRNRLEIIRDILTVIRNKNGKIKPTHILYKSNLSHQMMEDYLKELQDKQFIQKVSFGKHNSYSVTSKGNEFLEKYRSIENFKSSFGLDS